MLRIVFALLLALGTLPVVAQTPEPAPTPIPARQISEKTVKSVCRKVRGGDNFAEIRQRLAKKESTVFQFFKYGQCKQKLLGSGPYKIAGAYQLLLFEPQERAGVAIAVVDYFRNDVQNLNQLHSIVNQPDRYGRTILDLLDLLKKAEFSKDLQEAAWLNRVRGHLCAHGAVYTTPQEDCTMSDEVKEMLKQKKTS